MESSVLVLEGFGIFALFWLFCEFVALPVLVHRSHQQFLQRIRDLKIGP